MNVRTAVATLLLAGTVTSVPPAHGAAATGEPPTVRETGVVIECRSASQSLEAFVSIYENSRFANVFQVVVGDPDAGHGTSVERRRGFVDGRRVDARATLDGRATRVTGTVRWTGERTRVQERHDDAGQVVTVRGWHDHLATDLRLRHGKQRVRLTCDPAFAYNLRVTRTPIES